MSGKTGLLSFGFQEAGKRVGDGKNGGGDRIGEGRGGREENCDKQ